ncbi:unnamed protein product [Penicillium egyptiacum]|uniref:Biotin carboxylation domain-containing protein n=1 Tax=Penicillium egyptiacum TaxID=1303716 RepID=A0A9W4KGZ1_9EURO|nr:unnamed protein product [Penicillium egyptiacum]
MQSTPGMAFCLSAEFAQEVLDAGLTWIGPDPSVIEALGDKVEARHIAMRVGAPLVAGSDGPVSTVAEVLAFAQQHGLPVAIKAAYGGGARGLKVAWTMEEQFRIAEGLPLCVTHAPVPRGHSIEFRINAEDPGHDSLPPPGVITTFETSFGLGVRLESGVVAGSTIPAVYDSLMAKLIISGATREQVLARARRALQEFCISGLPTILLFHRAVLETDDFIGKCGLKVHMRWVETDFIAMPTPRVRPDPTETSVIRTSVEIDGKLVSVGNLSQLLSGLGSIGVGPAATAEREPEPSRSGSDNIFAPVCGTLRACTVTNAYVSKVDFLAVMEAMKMETQIAAPKAGIVRLAAKEGECLQAGDTLFIFQDSVLLEKY